jgi:hypothetical protein
VHEYMVSLIHFTGDIGKTEELQQVMENVEAGK